MSMSTSMTSASSSSSSMMGDSTGMPATMNKANQVMLRIYFVDDTHKTLMIDPKMITGEQLWDMVSDKIGIKNRDAECFFVWAQSDEIEWLLYSHQKIQEVITGWETIKKRYVDDQTSPTIRSVGTIRSKIVPTLTRKLSSPTLSSSNGSSSSKQTSPSTLKTKKGVTPSMSTSIAADHESKLSSSFPTLGEQGMFRLVYRATSVLPLSMERSIVSPEAIHLFYIQAIHHVINSNYPCDEDIALKLASIQLQVTVGDQKPEHQTHLRESLPNYIPYHLENKHKPEEWVSLLMPQHTLLRGSNAIALKKAYLETCQRWVYYGSTFFKAKYVPTTTSFFLQEFEGKVRIGINGYGVHIIDPKAMEIICWDSTTSSFSIQVQLASGSGRSTSSSSAQKGYIFKTSQGELIDDLLHDWMEEWTKEMKKDSSTSLSPAKK
ncbi:hypothetical protein SAMD00019534_104750 [Acytostelium subglobosum LB1]|uniref:hypothetical protein n=1 Tax=Acytostelium subglobosum LB1 TaxID=1410327 RepID=UPI000644EB05|nr:hypothetical protein SAMD00019534_104750 [Acytostelium subglobosum LB1]GAM27300.1 hypothetical protein SAMD00019534_104750 [Acytostelium subglobosum LB1]|eukprot:XP_012749767.1 hypothetical protein SAMD00019534_104750 [Acytostelium subglobosum LB1]